jgi:two-component system sensor histidine kinase UhpB
VLKHASASKVIVTLYSDASRVLLEVEDNGCGFDPAQPGSGGLGLVGIQERASRIGARLHLQSTLAQGTCLGVSLDWQPPSP